MKNIISKYKALSKTYQILIALVVLVIAIKLLPDTLVYALATFASYKLIDKKVWRYILVAWFGFLTCVSFILIFADDLPKVQEEKSVSSDLAQVEENKITSISTATENLSAVYDVLKVIDGDTLSINMNGKSETLRLIGIDTPETVDPRKPVQCFGREASNKAKELLSGKKIRIEKDSSQGELDKYKRLLAYIYTEDGILFNKYMIEQGYAHEYTYNLPYKYQIEFKEAEKSARENSRGLWAPGVCDYSDTKITPVSIPQSKEIPTLETKLDSSNYICSVNTYNCTDFTTHAESQKVYDACGGASNDIHKLDADKDGSACESLP